MRKLLIVIFGSIFAVSAILTIGSYVSKNPSLQTITETETASSENIDGVEILPENDNILENKLVVELEKETVAKTEPKNKTPKEELKVHQITIPVKTVDFEQINQKTRLAVVNILCTTGTGSLSPISGTGIIISDTGLILTNAHVAQYLLLKNFRYENFIQCIARTGSPAYPTYKLELVYISPDWIIENSKTIKDQNPLGTGEHDFAFLRITKNIDDSIATNIPFVKPDTRAVIDIGENTVLVSYPAGFLGGQTIAQNLSLVSSITQIQDVFTYREGTIDLIGVGGTVVSQKGSSGGAVVDDDGELIGVISTSSDGNTTRDRDLRAITTGYISRTLEKNIGQNLEQFTNSDIEQFAKTFQTEKAPELTKILTDILKQTN